MFGLFTANIVVLPESRTMTTEEIDLIKWVAEKNSEFCRASGSMLGIAALTGGFLYFLYRIHKTELENSRKL